MKLSIIIPAKNEEKLLPCLLESIREQTFTDYEIILADANSTDETRKIAASYGVKVVQGGMPGPGRNRGAEQAQGEVLLFLDADVDLVNHDFLKDCLAEMDERGLDVATVRLRPKEGKVVDHVMHEFFNTYSVATEKILPHAPGACIFSKRIVHQALHGFDEQVVFAEDMDYARRAKKFGYKFGIMRKQRLHLSMRRFEKDGRMMIAVKYVYGEIRMLTRGSFKKTPFTYVLGGDLEKEVEPVEIVEE